MRFLKYCAVFVVAGIAHYWIVSYLLAARMGRTMNLFEDATAQAIQVPSGGFDGIAIRMLLFPGVLLENANVLPQSLSGFVSIAFYALLATFLFFLIVKKMRC